MPIPNLEGTSCIELRLPISARGKITHCCFQNMPGWNADEAIRMLGRRLVIPTKT